MALWQLFLIFACINSRSYNDRLLRMSQSELGVVVDRALKMMEVTEALDLQESMQKKQEKETAVGKSKQHSIVLKRKRKDGSKDESGVNHDQDKFFEWLSRKAKQEHERTKDKSKTAGPYRSPLASNVPRKRKSQRQMRAEAKQAKKDSKRADKKVKKMEKKLKKLKKKMVKKDLKTSLKKMKKDMKKKTKKVVKKIKKDIKKAAKKTEKKQKKKEKKKKKKAAKKALKKKLKRYAKKQMKKEKKMLKTLKKPVKAKIKMSGKQEKMINDKLKSVKKSIKKTVKKAVKKAKKANTNNCPKCQDEALDMLNSNDWSDDPFVYFSKKGGKSKGIVWDVDENKKESAVYDVAPVDEDSDFLDSDDSESANSLINLDGDSAKLDTNYENLFPPLPKF